MMIWNLGLVLLLTSSIWADSLTREFDSHIVPPTRYKSRFLFWLPKREMDEGVTSIPGCSPDHFIPLHTLDYKHDRVVPECMINEMKQGILDLSECFFSNGSFPSIGDDISLYHYSPVLRAAEEGNEKLFDSLLTLIPYSKRGSPMIEPFLKLLQKEGYEKFSERYALYLNEEEIYTELNSTGETLLHIAARDDRHSSVLRNLLQKCTKGPDVVAADGRTPLYEAVINDCHNNIELILKQFGDPRLVVDRFPIWRHPNFRRWI